MDLIKSHCRKWTVKSAGQTREYRWRSLLQTNNPLKEKNMLLHPTLEKLTTMRFSGMATALEE
jgi:hypothetical protein